MVGSRSASASGHAPIAFTHPAGVRAALFQQLLCANSTSRRSARRSPLPAPAGPLRVQSMASRTSAACVWYSARWASESATNAQA